MKKILVDIYRSLYGYLDSDLPLGLRNGKIGILLFMALYSEYMKDKQARDISERLLAEIIPKVYSLPVRLKDGSWGALWVLQHLCNWEILEKDETMQRTLNRLALICRSSQTAVPIRKIPEDGLFSEGICTLAQWNEEDTLERYITAERLIGLVDECERLLTMDICGIHSPKTMPFSLLHSIVWYLKEMIRLKLYPYQAEQLLFKAANLYPILTDIDMVDRYVLTSLLSDRKMEFLKDQDNMTFCHILGKVGFYSLLYNCPELFRHLWKPFVLPSSLPVETLCGLGYGILQCKMNAYG